MFVVLGSISVIMVILTIKLIYRHNPHVREEYGSELILFHSNERYNKRIWRFNLIESLKNDQTLSDFQLKVVVGELSEDTLEVIKHAANENEGKITIIGGPKIFCEDKTEIYALLDKYTNVQYSILPIRPNKHFMIFNKKNIYIEKPHRHNETRGAMGIINSRPKLVQTFEDAFIKMHEHSRSLSKEEVLTQDCYKV